jgi:hypothetical protein
VTLTGCDQLRRAYDQVRAGLGPARRLHVAGQQHPLHRAERDRSDRVVFRFTGTDFAGRTASAESTVTVDPAQLGFEAVAKNRLDRVTVPAGYTATVLYRLGDPIRPNVSAYANNGT